MILTTEQIVFILFIGSLIVLGVKQYASIDSIKTKATILEMRNLAKSGNYHQTINKLSPWGTPYTSNDDYLEATIPIDYIQTELIETRPATTSGIVLRAYWRKADNPQAYFYKKRLYNE